MKILLLFFAIAYMVFQVQAIPVDDIVPDTIEPKQVGEEGTPLGTYTCNNRRGLCQRRDWACPSGYVFAESLNNCPYPHLNKCCVP